MRTGFQKIAQRVQSIRVLSTSDCGKLATQVRGLECRNITGTALTRYRAALLDGARPALFIAREFGRWVGFLRSTRRFWRTSAKEIGAVAHGMARRLATFEKLEALHQTTQRVTRELESYSRRVGESGGACAAPGRIC